MTDLENIKADLLVDCRGLSCPMPILRVKKELKNMKAGQIVELWSTDPKSKVKSSWVTSTKRDIHDIS